MMTMFLLNCVDIIGHWWSIDDCITGTGWSFHGRTQEKMVTNCFGNGRAAMKRRRIDQ